MLSKKRIFKKRKSIDIFNLLKILFISFVVLVILLYLIDANIKINNERNKLATRLESAKKELENLERQKKDYESRLSKIYSDEFWEKNLRDQGYKKPEEEVFVVLPPENSTSTVKAPENESFLKKILEKFKF
jgi:cell division protein FtsB